MTFVASPRRNNIRPDRVTAMAHDEDPGIDDATAHNDGALPDVSALTAAAVLASGDTVLRHALRRIAGEIGDSTPILAGFGNFAPSDPDPH